MGHTFRWHERVHHLYVYEQPRRTLAQLQRSAFLVIGFDYRLLGSEKLNDFKAHKLQGYGAADRAAEAFNHTIAPGLRTCSPAKHRHGHDNSTTYMLTAHFSRLTLMMMKGVLQAGTIYSLIGLFSNL